MKFCLKLLNTQFSGIQNQILTSKPSRIKLFFGYSENLKINASTKFKIICKTDIDYFLLSITQPTKCDRLHKAWVLFDKSRSLNVIDCS